jgi:hypothetical protein
MSWQEATLWWLPTGAVAAMTVLALLAMAGQPWRPSRKYRLAALFCAGALATAASFMEQARFLAAVDADAARQHDRDDRAAATLAALNTRVRELESQIQTLQEKSRARTIDDDTAAKIADYLRPFGSHRVVVSCLPGDGEACGYALQFTNVLRTAGWEALGPEMTTIFGEAPSPGVTLYVRGGPAPPEGARLLLDAFARFNIPYQGGVAPSDAIPDPATVELFVGRKQ